MDIIEFHPVCGGSYKIQRYRYNNAYTVIARCTLTHTMICYLIQLQHIFHLNYVELHRITSINQLINYLCI